MAGALTVRFGLGAIRGKSLYGVWFISLHVTHDVSMVNEYSYLFDTSFSLVAVGQKHTYIHTYIHLILRLVRVKPVKSYS